MQESARRLVDRLTSGFEARRHLLRQRYLQDCVFIHINKTGGTSIEAALGLNFQHRTAAEMRARLGSAAWQRKFTFSVVRNPWDRVASQYDYRVMTNQTGLADEKIPFTEWVIRAYGESEPSLRDRRRMFMPQLDWLTDSDGNVIVDFVGRFENLAGDFEEICARLGRTAALPHLKASPPRAGYRERYDAESRAVVASHFSRDIEYFGYDW